MINTLSLQYDIHVLYRLPLITRVIIPFCTHDPTLHCSVDITNYYITLTPKQTPT